MSDIASMKALAERARPGPWKMSDWSADTVAVETDEGEDEVARVCFINRHEKRADNTMEERNTTAFIAAANPAAVLALIAKLEETATALEAATKEIERMRGGEWPEDRVLLWFSDPKNADRVMPAAGRNPAQALLSSGFLRFVDHGGDDPYVELTEQGLSRAARIRTAIQGGENAE